MTCSSVCVVGIVVILGSSVACISVCIVCVVGMLDDRLVLLVRAIGGDWFVLCCLYLLLDLVGAIFGVLGVVLGVAALGMLGNVVLVGATCSPSNAMTSNSDTLNRCIFSSGFGWLGM